MKTFIILIVLTVGVLYVHSSPVPNVDNNKDCLQCPDSLVEVFTLDENDGLNSRIKRQFGHNNHHGGRGGGGDYGRGHGGRGGFNDHGRGHGGHDFGGRGFSDHGRGHGGHDFGGRGGRDRY